MPFYSSLADTPLEQFTHNNMVPFFGSGITQNLNENMNQTLLGKYTGVDDNTRIEKMEQTNFTDIQKNVFTHENSQSYLVEYDRMETSTFHNNVLPTEQIKVGPGTKYTDPVKSTGGFQQDEYRDIAYYKDIDDLRVKTNPKESYEGRVVDGIKETQRGKFGTVDKNRVDTYYEKTEADLFKTTGAYTKDKIRPCVEVKETNRKEAREYQGAAHKNIGGVKYGTVQETHKQTLENYGDRNAQMTNTGKGYEYDYGKKNIMVYNNERDITSTKTYEGNITSYIKSMISPFTDVIKRSNKEYFVQNPRQFGQMQSTLPNKQTMYDPNDIARTTIKETLVEDTRTGNLKGVEQITTYDPNDVARTTIKETLIHDTKLGNMKNVFKSIVYNPNEVAKNTIRQTLDTTDGTVNLKGHNMQQVYDPNDIAKTTVKETTIDNDVLGIVSGQDRGGGHLTNKHAAKHTNKEFTSDNDYMGNPDQQNTDGYKTATFEAKTTNKQITSDKEYFGAAGNEHEATMSYSDIYNAVINDTREQTLAKPSPTQTGVKVNSGKEFVHLTNIKVPCNKDDTANISKIYQDPPSTQFINFTQNKNVKVADTTQERLDPGLLQAFRKNPYTHSLNNAV
uniref:Uncharacterized protein n=1 Tax=Pyramimonas orientalis virus TaxID=455367 RepID=A0A7M3UP03_POV01|nr:putative protein L454 [Pyramimonas orientalis virus]